MKNCVIVILFDDAFSSWHKTKLINVIRSIYVELSIEQLMVKNFLHFVPKNLDRHSNRGNSNQFKIW